MQRCSVLRRRTTALLSVLVAAWVVSDDAFAQTSSNGDPGGSPAGSRPDFAFGSPEGEAAMLALSASSNITYVLPQRIWTWAPYSRVEYDPYLSGWSDFTGALGGAMVQLGIGYALEAAYYFEVGTETSPGLMALYNPMIESEALLMTSGITMLMKRAAGRCRPRSYPGASKPCPEGDAFPSGHTSAVAAFAGARIVRLAFTPINPAFAFRATSLIVSEGAMFLTGALRILSGAHSIEDVIVAGLIGHVTGAGVALIHWNERLDNEQTAPAAQELHLSEPVARPLPPLYFTWGAPF